MAAKATPNDGLRDRGQLIPNVQTIVAAAMRSRRRLKVHYDRRVAPRVLEPHLIFLSEEKSLNLLAYQVRGYHSSKRQGPFWRPFQLRKIDHISVMDELFEPRIEAGFFKVVAMVKGEILLRVEEAGDYTYFNTEIYGPPSPRQVD